MIIQNILNTIALQGKQIRQKLKSVDFDAISARILLIVVFLLPLFVLPLGIFVVDFNKAILFYVGVSLAAIFFLVARVLARNILFPKSFIIASLFFVMFAWLVSSFFSNNITLSLVGTGYETGTFTFFLFLSVMAFLVSTLFSSAKRILLLYGVIFATSIILFIIQFLHSGLAVQIPPWDMFSDKTSSVAGNWNDLGVFFGLIALIAASFLEFLTENKRLRACLWGILGMSLIVVFFVNFSTLHFTLGFLVLALLAYQLTEPMLVNEPQAITKKSFFHPSFFVFLFIVILVLARGFIGDLVTFLGLQFSQFYPSWSVTAGVIKSVLLDNLFFGSGPNTFLYDWLFYRSEAISNTMFWDTTFRSGAGRIPSMIAETGILGTVAFATFLFSILYKGSAVAFYRKENITKMLLVSSFLGSVYLWVFAVIYTPGFLISAFAGIFTGIFVASLGLINEQPRMEIFFEDKSKKSYTLYFFGVIIAAGLVYSIYVFTTKYIAGYYYSSALKEASVRNDITKADMYLQKAVRFAPEDVYFRSAAEIGLLELEQIFEKLNTESEITEIEKAKFRETLSATVQNAKNATVKNPLDPQNWMELGKVYEAILPVDPRGLKSSAVFAYGEAFRMSPHNPLPLLALARIELQDGNQEGAMNYLSESLKIKSDFVAGHIMRAQIAVSQGKQKEAISELKETVILNPYNPDNAYIVFRIALLYYQDGDYKEAQSILEELVLKNPNYIDAKYALGILYEKNGDTGKAIKQFEEINLLMPENIEIQAILNNLYSGLGVSGNNLASSSAKVTEEKKALNKK